MAETQKQWLKRIGSRRALQERVKQRLRGEINRPVPGPRGLKACYRELHRRGIR